ncbi:unnamed protein product [Sphagnum troendelagicum]|uniref:1,3-beta-glucan synthase n=1 Tax=Sphagnum troendelagicum TaxID=128251 RepID=A0ABP0UQW2_9BRYO
MERPPRSNRISKRVLGNWERLVYARLRADEGRTGFNHEDYRRTTPETSGSSQAVPQSLSDQANIEAILQAADEVDDVQVARLLCQYAFDLVQKLDPTSEGRGVLQFKTGLQSIIKRKQAARAGQQMDRNEEIILVQDYYTRYRAEHGIDQMEEEFRLQQAGQLSGGEPDSMEKRARMMRKVYEISRILNDVVDYLLTTAEPEAALRLQLTEEKRRLEEDAKKVKEYQTFNILPLERPGVYNAFSYFPEVTAATRAFLYTADLPIFPEEYERDERPLDLFHFLHYCFGFQRDNVANQREHLILLLASAQTRMGFLPDTEFSKLDDATINNVHQRILENYIRWCRFVRRDPMSKRAFTQQRRLFLTALYLLVWGEASNLRFMPECLCYIFHHMADELFDLLEQPYVERSKCVKPNADNIVEFSFLEQIITPVYQVVAAEAQSSGNGIAPHGAWRNYDDFNEFFWAPNCFELSWPWRLESGFFMKPQKPKSSWSFRREEKPVAVPGRRKEHKVGKIHFVEHRTAFHLYHSFHRLWIFFLCMLQGLTIWAFCSKNKTLNLHVRTIKKIMSVVPTFVVMKLFKALLDALFMWGAYRSTRLRIVVRMLLRCVWYAGMSAAIIFLYVKTLQEDSSNTGSQKWFTIFYIVVASYAGTLLVLSVLFRIPWLRRQADKCSNLSIIQFIKWVQQERYYVGRGLYERMRDYIRYLLFWIFLLACKFAFSFHFQIMPMVSLTRLVINIKDIHYRWHDDISSSNHNALTLVALWAAVVLIYFVDIQVWYTVISALLGGLEGARDKLGEIRTLAMLRKRFASFPEVFVRHMQPPRLGSQMSSQMSPADGGAPVGSKAIKEKVDAIKFAPIWNKVIKSLREEDLINNRERDLLIMPDNRISYTDEGPNLLIHWPLFLLANKVQIAVELAAGYKIGSQTELSDEIRRDEYMGFAVQEAFQGLEATLLSLLNHAGQHWVERVFQCVKRDVEYGNFVSRFRLSKLRDVLEKTRELTEQLGHEETPDRRTKAKAALGLLFEVVWDDFIPSDLREEMIRGPVFQHPASLLSDLHWPNEFRQAAAGRLNDLLAVQKIKDAEGKTKTLDTESIPHNLEARRRLEFFTNSLFMHMPETPPTRKMHSFCVLTPYYEEDVMYSLDDLSKENEDGISILFYLQKIYPDEWQNFLERIQLIENTLRRTVDQKKSEKHEETVMDLRLWASYRGQTLARTVRGMMYYKTALILQGQQEGASNTDVEQGLPLSMVQTHGADRSALAQAELKFVYVVTCQIYGEQKKRGKAQAADILYLMQQNSSLRVAYIDIVETTKDRKTATSYYSKLVKAGPSGKDEIIYSIKLPGKVILGEGKPENQNHAIIFTRGDAIQTIDMNQDHFLEEALKVRNLLEEFDCKHGLRRPTILGVREHVFTGSVSSLAWFMSMQESSFVTLGQRVLARPLKVRMHYGHPDVFDRVFHITRGGISKASRVINLSEDIFAGFNSTLRQGNITHHEYIQVGKGRDVGLNQIALFEAKVASGNGEQLLSRDVYRLGQLFDFFRMLSFFFTSVGFYVTTMMTVLTLYAFLYGKAYLALSGVDASLRSSSNVLENTALQATLNTQFLFQIGIFSAVPMIVNLILEEGILRAVISFCAMQLQLASVFFTFSLGTRTHYFGRTVLHGGAKYRSTGRGFVVRHIKFAENYRQYSRSHFTKALEIIILLIVYLAYGAEDRTAVTYILLTFSSWFLALSWLFAPYIFNPSGFEWQKTVEDFDDWTGWLFYKGGVGVKIDYSWEAWWFDEQTHIRSTRGRFWEFMLSLRFFLFQYGVVYALNVTQHSTAFSVYLYSWLVLIGLVIIFKIFSFSESISANFQLTVRTFQALLFTAIIASLVVTVKKTPLTIGDVFSMALAFIPTGWGLLNIAIAFRPWLEKTIIWKSVREVARIYDACMGMLIFIPVAFLSWFPFVSTFQTRLVFNQAFSRGLEISLILAGNRPNKNM